MHMYNVLNDYLNIVMLVFRASPWLLAITLVGLTLVSHDILKEEETVCRLTSCDGDEVNIDNLPSNKYLIITCSTVRNH